MAAKQSKTGHAESLKYPEKTTAILSPDITEAGLAAAAVRAMQHSWSPYSKFRVGAALLTDDGAVYTGCNIENASFGATNCAERTAIFKAVSEGKTSFSAIAIAGGPEGRIGGICTPCGICRQVLSEFCGPDLTVLLVHKDGFDRYTLGDLLPLSFSL